jgi:CRISPR-associated endonuclease/helicase Cas3
LRGVYRIAIKQFDQVKCDFPNFKRDELREVISVTSLFHDFGKATTFFQEYLENPNKPSNDNKRMKRRHGLISAIVTYQILEKRFPDNSILPIFGFIVVRRHHGNLEDYRKMLIISDEDLQNCRIQTEHINYGELQQIDKIFDNSKSLFESFQYRDMRKLRRKDNEFSTEHYFVLNLLYSILLHADKTDAILNGNSVQKSKMLMSKDVSNFKNGFNNNPENPIDAIRENAFESVENTIENLNKSERILSINIPTGSGKTITSLNAALKLCEKFGHDHVVYCLPFTSVIDQNFQVFDEIRNIANIPEDSGVLLKHHHLTDIRYNSVTDENAVKEYLPNEALHLIEGWESGIIVTTFVQFMYSLITYKNASLRKFHRFSNTVIILDEVQSIPHHYWKLIKEMLSKMAEWLNSRIVLVTATMPLIFSEQDGEIKELVSEKKEMFAGLNRIELDVSNLKIEKMEWKEFCESAKKMVNDNPTKDILFVMNTIRSAKDLYLLFFELDIPHKLEFLSAHIIPKHRLRRITDIKNRNQKEPKLVVSTQLVEAGVDIDLDVVVRDFAPLDSIFQTCGRCNRENRNGVKGKVILFSLKDSNDWIPSGIYKNFLKQKTKKILVGKEIIPESEFFNLANDYFQEVKIGGSQTQSNNLLEKIEKLRYADGDQKIEIKLIDDNFTSSIFIECDDQAKQFWKKYQHVLEMENGFEKNSDLKQARRNLALKQARRNLAEYIINVPNKCLPIGNNDGIYHLCKDQIEEFYDPITGFKLEKQLPCFASQPFGQIA